MTAANDPHHLSDANSNVNALNPGTKADLTESCSVHSINVSTVPA